MNRARSAIAAVIVVAALGAALVAGSAAAEPPQLEAKLLRSYDAFDANQAVAVDRSHFFAVDNTSITQHDRKSGAPLLQFAGAEGGPLIHMDRGAVYHGLLHAAHSNYDESPMESSVEIFDARTLRHGSGRRSGRSATPAAHGAPTGGSGSPATTSTRPT